MPLESKLATPQGVISSHGLVMGKKKKKNLLWNHEAQVLKVS